VPYNQYLLGRSPELLDGESEAGGYLIPSAIWVTIAAVLS